MAKLVWDILYEGDSKEAQVKFPFISKGLHLKVLSAMSTAIGVFPLKDSFYIVTYKTKEDGFKAIIEETNSIEFINITMKRETGHCQWLDDKQLKKVTNFLKNNNCKYIS